MPATPECSNDELRERLIALETGLRAFKELMEERDKRYAARSLSQDTAVEAALDTSREAITGAEAATERRLETLNELRGVVVDQARDFARKAEVQLLVEGIEKRVDVLSGLIHERVARGGGAKDLFSYLVAAAGLLLAALAIYFHR
jgi:hypothetical protein